MTVCRILFCSPGPRLLAVKTLRRFFLSPETACHGMTQLPCRYVCICFRVLIKPAPLSCTLLSNLFLFTVTAFHRNINRFLHFRQNTPNASSIKTFLHPGFPIYSNYPKLMACLCEILSFPLPPNLPMSDFSAKFYKIIISPSLRRQSLQDYRTFYRLLP